MIDARRGEVYCAIHDPRNDAISKDIGVFVCAPETVMDRVAESSLLVGSGAISYRMIFESGRRGYRFADPAFHVIRASSVGLLALERFRRNEIDSVETLAPEYVRPSDAQIQISKKI
jgi:tRNA threonylcarbamoyladenosine biosynthesis protein TsaB